ncbi:hypothetical protein [Pseudoclavibacter sp. 13-3]|uniref:hypothetical protein n=1 Tax=Pseudoclavibacter sp. 13-3 TaxID=2901228 RepID=UPI001E550317|nr:hypothetical protein [Pseudoclavibacter sp. 13-3]MCD7101958.1 hypothetical protein [Pseudoclavibacter sp. 13-3]
MAVNNENNENNEDKQNESNDIASPDLPETGDRADRTSPQEGAAEQHEEGRTRGRGNAEAARYRKELREAEAARDSLQSDLDALRSEIARGKIEAAATGLTDPALLFELGGVDVADLLDARGEVDGDAVEAAVADLVAERPYLAAAKVEPPSTFDAFAAAVQAEMEAAPDERRALDPRSTGGKEVTYDLPRDRVERRAGRKIVERLIEHFDLKLTLRDPAAWAAEHSSQPVRPQPSRPQSWAEAIRDSRR